MSLSTTPISYFFNNLFPWNISLSNLYSLIIPFFFDLITCIYSTIDLFSFYRCGLFDAYNDYMNSISNVDGELSIKHNKTKEKKLSDNNNLKRELTTAYDDIITGNGTPNIDSGTGLQKVYRGDEFSDPGSPY